MRKIFVYGTLKESAWLMQSLATQWGADESHWNYLGEAATYDGVFGLVNTDDNVPIAYLDFSDTGKRLVGEMVEVSDDMYMAISYIEEGAGYHFVKLRVWPLLKRTVDGVAVNSLGTGHYGADYDDLVDVTCWLYNSKPISRINGDRVGARCIDDEHEDYDNVEWIVPQWKGVDNEDD